MATGYGYVRDKEPLSINWAEISKGFNDRLNEAEAERQSKREDIQKQYDELSQKLINKPVGYNTDLNDVISSYSMQASQASLENLNKLKRGEISEQEYYSRRANLKSSTQNFFLYANNFNQKLDENMKLIQSQDPDNQGSGRMAFQLALAQDMLNFKNTKAIIDPATDELILVKTDKNGEPTNEIVDVSQLGYLSSLQENSYNYRQQIANRLKGKGARKTRDKDGREVITILGAEINSQTAQDTIDAMAESLIGDERQTLSILYQNGYKYTQDESLKGQDGYIYYDIKNNTYDYDPAKAKEILVEEITSSIPETIIEPKELTANEKEIERLRIEVLKNQVEKGDLEIKGIRADDIDTSNLQAEVKRDINETVGQELINTFDSNYYSLAGGAQKKGSNAVKASLDLLNSYASGFGTTITEDGTNITFSTPAFDASGKALAKPIEISYSLENITDGNTVKALLENFITLYPGKRFINNAYKTGRFNQSTGAVTTPSEIQTTNTDTDTTPVNVNQAASDYGIDLNQINTTTPSPTEPTQTVVEENVTTQEDNPAVIQAKRRTWIKKIKPLTLDEKNDDGSPVFDRAKFQNTARFATVTEKVGGKVKDKFLTAEFARLYPDYPHEIYGQTEVFGKAEEIEANKKQTAADKIKARKNKQAKDKLLSSQTRIERLIEEVEKEAGRDLSIEEQVEIEKGNLPDIDFSSDFTQKYSYLFD
jgi:hypothetical protein